jgi:hypothetical protein
MSSRIRGQWISEVARANGIPDSMNPTLVSKLCLEVEAQMQKLLQDAKIFQRRARQKILTVEELNQALEMNDQEHVYGLTS